MENFRNWPVGPPKKHKAQRLLGVVLYQGWAASDRNDTTNRTRWQAFKARRLSNRKDAGNRRWRRVVS